MGEAGTGARSGEKVLECGLDVGYGGRAGYRHRGHPELGRLLGQQAGLAAAGSQGDHPEPAGIAPDDVERLGADRAGGTEDHDLARLRFHRSIVRYPRTRPRRRPDNAVG
jgi:hypothetical protein